MYQHLSSQVELLQPHDYLNAQVLLASSEWDGLENIYAHSAHPLTGDAARARDVHLEIALSIWERIGLGTIEPIALYKDELNNFLAIDTALQLLEKIYWGANLAYAPAPMGFWKTLHALTAYVISDRIDNADRRHQFTQKVMQFWLLAWLNPQAVAPGRMGVACEFVTRLAELCKFSQMTPAHAGSGVAVADLATDFPPVPFTRLPEDWEGQTQLFLNAQDAAFMMNHMLSDGLEASADRLFASLQQSVAPRAAESDRLRQIDVRDFIARSFKVFGYNNIRNMPRQRAGGEAEVVVGFIDVWSAVEHQNLLQTHRSTEHALQPESHKAQVKNVSDGGFLLKFKLDEPLVVVGSLLALRNTPAEPWSLLVIRWLEDRPGAVLVGCELLCNFAYARVAALDAGQTRHIPILTYRSNDATAVLLPEDQIDATMVTQLRVAEQDWILSSTTEPGQDWQKSLLIDIAQTPEVLRAG